MTNIDFLALNNKIVLFTGLRNKTVAFGHKFFTDQVVVEDGKDYPGQVIITEHETRNSQKREVVDTRVFYYWTKNPRFAMKKYISRIRRSLRSERWNISSVQIKIITIFGLLKRTRRPLGS
jgi:hypothetical protein